MLQLNIRQLIIGNRKIFSKKSPFESLLILFLFYVFVELYYSHFKANLVVAKQKIKAPVKSAPPPTLISPSSSAGYLSEAVNQKVLCKEQHQPDWLALPSSMSPNWRLNASAPLPATRVPPLDKKLVTIPKIIHQTWKTTDDVPNQFTIWSDTCKNLHPTWEYRLWSDEDNLAFVKEHFSWFLDIYNDLPFDISRVDSIRYMVLFKIGGFYIDLDMECLKPLDPFLNAGILMSRLSDDPKIEFSEHAVPNSWLGSAPGHPFWMFLLQKMAIQYKDGKSVQVEHIGGSIFMHDSVVEWRDMELDISVPTIQYLHHGRIYGYDWRIPGNEMRFCSAQDDDFDPRVCKTLIPKNAVMITYFSKLWGNWMMHGKMQKSDFH